MNETNTNFAKRRGSSWPLMLAAIVLAGHSAAAVYPGAMANSKETQADWYRQCLRVRALQPPAKDLPRGANLERCDAADLYYDTQHMQAPADTDWSRVRECAFRTNASGVLMMLYANGTGVSTNLSLATRYACSIASSPAEMRARLAHLRRKSADAGDRLDLCDDISSGHMHGYCATVRERQRDKQRNDQLAALVQGWDAKEQLGLDMVNKAAHYFAQHRSDYETDLSGSAKRALQVETASAELDQFMRDVQDFERGKVPHYSEAEFRALEDKLNQTYQQFMATRVTGASYLGTIRKAGVEKTQHAWLAFRDAMELFGSVKYPAAPASGLRALLTSRRLRQLAELENAAKGR